MKSRLSKSSFNLRLTGGGTGDQPPSTSYNYTISKRSDDQALNHSTVDLHRQTTSSSKSAYLSVHQYSKRRDDGDGGGNNGDDDDDDDRHLVNRRHQTPTSTGDHFVQQKRRTQRDNRNEYSERANSSLSPAVQSSFSSSSSHHHPLTKTNSRSVFSLYPSRSTISTNTHSNGSGWSSVVDVADATRSNTPKRKGSITFKQILLDRLLKTGHSPSSSTNHLNESSRVARNLFNSPSSPSSTQQQPKSPLFNQPLERKLNQIKLQSGSGSKSTFELRSTTTPTTRLFTMASDGRESPPVFEDGPGQQPDSGLGMTTDSERSSSKRKRFHKNRHHHQSVVANNDSQQQSTNQQQQFAMLAKLTRSHSLNDLSALPIDQEFDWKGYGDAYQAEICERRHELYITEIEMDSVLQTGPTLRAIYDGDEYDKFMDRLDMRIKSHDKDIERMCNAHYQGFVDCIHELLKVRPQSEQLKKGVMEINLEIQKSSDNIQRKAEELIKFRRILCNTEAAIEHLSVCLPVLDTYSKLLQQMREDKYYLALKTLEQLESNCFPRVEKYDWAQAMIRKIPQVREHIKNASMSDLKDFLETIRKLSSKIGEVAMRNAAIQQNMDETILNCQSTSSSSVESSTQSSPTGNGSTNVNLLQNASNYAKKQAKLKKRKAPQPPGKGSSYAEENNNLNNIDGDTDGDGYSIDEELSATDLVDFSPVYRCLHIYTCLGARETFEHYYRQQRQQQAKLALQAPMNMHENLESYKNYFSGIVGFFVIEDHILSTGNGLITKEYLDSIWQNSLQSVVASLRTHSSYCTDAKLMLHIKRIVILFIYTLQSYGYNVNQLFRLLIEIRDQYNEILMKQWVTVFRNIFEADNYHPMVVNNIKELNDLLMEFPFYEVEALNLNGLNDTLENDEQSSINKQEAKESLSDASESGSTTTTRSRRKHKGSEFPKKFPFSSFVPKVFREVKQFIHACLEFSADLNNSQSEIEDMVRKSTNILLTRTLSGCLSALIKKPNLGLLQLIQITINTNYLEEASVYLEEYISKTIGYNYSNLVSASQANMLGSLGNSGSSATIGIMSSSTSSQHLSRLQGKSMFKDARADAESQIYLQLNQKIDEFLELANYDWMCKDLEKGVASVYISDLIAFLRSTFEAFTNLPLKVAQTACHSACKHIASSLMGFLMDEEVKCISKDALVQFNLDLVQCEAFAQSEPVRGFEDGDLEMCFAELRQLMNLFLEEEWSIYIDHFGKQHSKYLRVNPVTVLNLLEKVREANKKTNFLGFLKKNDKFKHGLSDMVMVRLRELASGSGTAT